MRGFTFIELMIVVIIIVLIAAIFTPQLDIQECLSEGHDKQYCIDELKVKDEEDPPMTWASGAATVITINGTRYTCSAE